MNSLAAESFPKEYSLGNHNAICWEIMEVQHHELLFNYCNVNVEVPAAGDQLKNNLFALYNLHKNFQTTLTIWNGQSNLTKTGIEVLFVGVILVFL